VANNGNARNVVVSGQSAFRHCRPEPGRREWGGKPNLIIALYLGIGLPPIQQGNDPDES
jgi:hypothetical protein